MRRFLSVLVLSLTVIPPILLSGSQDQAGELSDTQRVYVASRLYASLDYFAHWEDAQDVDVETVYRNYLNKVLAASNRAAFSRSSMEFMASFHNSHTMFLDRALIQQAGSLPFIARFVDDQWVVTESRIDDIVPGAVIESIDGKPFEEFFQERRRFISASTESWARRALFAEAPDFAPFAHLLPMQFVLGIERGR